MWGISCAEILGTHLASLGIQFDRCISGDLQRQRHTAEAALGRIAEAGIAIPQLEVDSAFNEFDADAVIRAHLPDLLDAEPQALHIMRNALLPFVTIVGLMMANFIGGAVVTEAVFTYPGLGRLLIQAITTRDYPLLQGCILVILVLYVTVNLCIDLLYAWIDPRIDYG